MKRTVSLLLSLIMMLTSFSYLTMTSASADSVIETAISWAVDIANDNSHGYSWDGRWGPDYDCSSLVISAFKKAGANTGSATYTGNMRSQFTENHDFKWISWNEIGSVSNLQRGDILLDESAHTEIYLGNSQNVGAHRGYKSQWCSHSNSDGKYHRHGHYDLGEQQGDQDGGEICVGNYYNNSGGVSWNGVLRYQPQEPPKNPTISKNQVWFDLKDTISLIGYADNATRYIAVIDDSSGNRLVDEVASSNEFTISAQTLYNQSGYGDYWACMIIENSAGGVQTEWIKIPIVGDAGYSGVYTSSWWYDLSDTVSISVDSVCAKGQWIGIDKEGVGRVITQQSDSTFTIPASNLGIGVYSAYFTVYNGSGGIDTERVTFEIVDKPKDGAVVTSSKKSYTLDEVVEVSVLAYCTKGRVIGIDKEGVGRVVTENCGTSYTVPASQLGRGKYSAYFSVYNGSGGYDTERVEFAIDNLLTNPQISINKEDFINDEEIVIKASADGGVSEYTLTIFDNHKNVIKNETFIGHEVSVNSRNLGVGIYTAQVKCSNYAFDVYTDELTFAVKDYNPEVPDNAQVGDVDGDGDVTIMDATLIQIHLAKTDELTADQLAVADTDKDGEITIMDVTRIQLYLARIIPEF